MNEDIEDVEKSVATGAAEVLGSLEPGQLSGSKRHFARRYLKGPQVFLLWALRVYVLFMIAVVLYQFWSGIQ
jgi:hypothetical protein